MSTVQLKTPERQRDRVVLRRKLIAVIFAAVPTAIVALFAIAEGIGSEPGWWGHLIQLALVVTPTVLAWLWPKIGGPILILAGLAFAVFVMVMSRPVGQSLLTVAVVFLPLMIAGILFTRIGYAPSATDHGDRPTE